MDNGFLAGLSGGLSGLTSGIQYRREKKRQDSQDAMERARFEAAMSQYNNELEQSRWKHQQDVETASRLRKTPADLFTSGMENVPLDLMPQFQDYQGMQQRQGAFEQQQGAYNQQYGPVPESVSQQLPWAQGMNQSQFGQYAPAMLDAAQLQAKQNQPQMQGDPWSNENALRLYEGQARVRGDLMKEGLSLAIQQDPELSARIAAVEQSNFGTPLTYDQIFRMIPLDTQQSIQDYADQAAQFYWQQANNPYGSMQQPVTSGGGQGLPQSGGPAPSGASATPQTPMGQEQALVQEGQQMIPAHLLEAYGRTALGQQQVPSWGGGTIPASQGFARDFRPGMRPENVMESQLTQTGQMEPVGQALKRFWDQYGGSAINYYRGKKKTPSKGKK